MKRIEATFGYREIHDDGTIKYFGGETGNGLVYKDDEAYNSGFGTCYIGEYELEDQNGETRESIFNMVRNYISYYELPLIDEFVEYISDIIYNNATWADISTELEQVELVALFKEKYATDKKCPICGEILCKEVELDYPYFCVDCEENFTESEALPLD